MLAPSTDALLRVDHTAQLGKFTVGVHYALKYGLELSGEHKKMFESTSNIGAVKERVTLE